MARDEGRVPHPKASHSGTVRVIVHRLLCHGIASEDMKQLEANPEAKRYQEAPVVPASQTARSQYPWANMTIP